MIITSFKGPAVFLSNFYRCTFVYQGIVWPSAEHAFQAMKAPDPCSWLSYANIPTAAEAKKIGRRPPIRHDWDTIKRRVMLEVLLAKFSDNGELRDRLLQTAPAVLVEGNTWGDIYWGAVAPGTKNFTNALPYWHHGPNNSYVLAGENWLGKLLIMTRDVLS